MRGTIRRCIVSGGDADTASLFIRPAYIDGLITTVPVHRCPCDSTGDRPPPLDSCHRRAGPVAPRACAVIDHRDEHPTCRAARLCQALDRTLWLVTHLTGSTVAYLMTDGPTSLDSDPACGCGRERVQPSAQVTPVAFVIGITPACAGPSPWRPVRSDRPSSSVIAPRRPLGESSQQTNISGARIGSRHGHGGGLGVMAGVSW